MLETFNCGIGYALIVAKNAAIKIQERVLNEFKIRSYILGEVVRKVDKDVTYE